MPYGLLFLQPWCSTNVLFTIKPALYASFTAETATFKIVTQLDDPSRDMPWMSIRVRSFSYPDISFSVMRLNNSETEYIGVTTVNNRFPFDLTGVVGRISVRRQGASGIAASQVTLNSPSIPPSSCVAIANSFSRLPHGTYRVSMEVKSDMWPLVKREQDLEIE